MKPNYYYLATFLLFILGLTIGYLVCAYLEQKKQQVAVSNEKSSLRQTYLAELSKKEASQEPYYAKLSKKKAAQEKFHAEISAEKAKLEALIEHARSTKILGLRTTVYQVNDLEKATIWYSKAFQEVPYFKESYYVGFNIEGFELGLQPTEEKFTTPKTNVVAYWGVENIEQQYQRLLDFGAKGLGKPTNVGGEIVTATLVDPFGNVIGLIYNPDF
jgi:lactoylglutathione lyase